MNKVDKRFLLIVFLLIAVLFLFFGSGEIINGSMNGKMNENGWLGRNSWWWFSTSVILVFGAAFVWLFYSRKKLIK